MNEYTHVLITSLKNGQKACSHTWTILSVAGFCGFTTARLAAVFGRGVTASPSADTTTASDGALITPFGPVPIQHIAVVIQVAPVARAIGRQTERINATETTTMQTHMAALAPGTWDCAM